MHMLINVIGFKIGWVSAVMGAAAQMPWLGPAVFAIVVLVHLRQARRPELELGLVIAAGTIGIWFDSFIVAMGWVTYPSGQFSPVLAPYWIVTMWMLFATTLNRSMVWLRGRTALAAAIGAVAGPGSYYAGQKLGAIEFVAPAAGLLTLAIGWAIIMPVLMTLAARLDGFRPATVGERP
ncbi:MAG: DUF2878 domain-containing protein [Woeseiaceae bacterium]|nr:DUF2878 domain-containing protein [Woeseiaceae bacterium]